MKGLNERTIKEGLKEISNDDYEIAFDALSRKRLEQLTTETDNYKNAKTS